MKINESQKKRKFVELALIAALIFPTLCRAQSQLPTTGIHGDVVTLNDLEDHTWTYYSGNIAGLSSPDPRNVMITYRAGTVDGSNSTPCVSINETQTTFVYYKTLEKEGNYYPYELIPNPFSVRPSKTSSTGTKTYYGAYQWKLISASPEITIHDASDYNTVYTTASGENIIPGETKLLFEINDAHYTTDFEHISAEIVFEAYWEKAKVKRLTSNTSVGTSGLSNSNHEELNIVVINANVPITASNLQVARNVTFTMVEPDGQPYNGEVDHRRASCYLTGGYFCQANTKFEYININDNITTYYDDADVHQYLYPNGGTEINYDRPYADPQGLENGGLSGNEIINQYRPFVDATYYCANEKNLTIGRGVSNTDPTRHTIEWVTGIQLVSSNTPPTTHDINDREQLLDYRIRIESGKYATISLFTGRYTWLNDQNRCKYTNSNNHVVATLGCDYDRANNDTNNLVIRKGINSGNTLQYKANGVYHNGCFSLNNPNHELVTATIKSGKFTTSLLNQGVFYVFYVGIYGGAVTTGKKNVLIEGGVVSGIAGDVGVGDFRLRMKGGKIRGCIYGAAEYNAGANGDRYIILSGGEVNGWIAGGCNGTAGGNIVNYGVTEGNTFIYIGGKARVDSHGNNTAYQSSIGGNVYGAGSGFSTDYKQIGRVTNSTVVIADNGYVERDVYGGGNFGNTLHTANVYIKDNCIIDGNVYGGACENDGENSNIYMTGGSVIGGIYGGCNVTGDMTQNTAISISGGTVGVSGVNTSHVCGGGYGEPTAVLGNTDVTIGVASQGDGNPMIHGDVYGGSDLGKVNGNSDEATGGKNSTVTMHSGTLSGSLFGGGFGSTAKTWGSTTVNLLGGTVRGNVYGGGNGAPVEGSTNVTVGQ